MNKVIAVIIADKDVIDELNTYPLYVCNVVSTADLEEELNYINGEDE